MILRTKQRFPQQRRQKISLPALIRSASFQPTPYSGWRIGPALHHSLRLNDFLEQRDRI